MAEELSYFVSYNNIIFLESLHNESKTGKWLYEDIKPLTYKYKVFETNYVPVKSKHELMEALMGIELAILNQNMLPIIHLDLHGNKDGFEVNPSGEFISWKQLQDTFMHMNTATKNNLIICMNVCEGFYGILDAYEKLISELPCPFFMCIGPQTKVLNIDVRNSYQKFYKILIETQDINKAIISLNEDENIHHVAVADNMIIDFQRNLKSLFQTSSYKSKCNSELQKLLMEGDKRFLDINFNRSSKKYIKHKREMMKNIFFEKAKKFLMIDKYPELELKFKIEQRMSEI